MRILGVYAGIGSPMVNPYKDGHTVVGNIEPRSFAHAFDAEGKNTFLENFPGAWLVKKVDEVPLSELLDIDIIAGHPKCGRYSNLVNKKKADMEEYSKKKSDEFLEYIRIVNMVKPKFAFFDNLPKSLVANPPELYRSLLPEYHVNVEYVSNFYYGNCQTNRNRLFIIASLKELEYDFFPGEQEYGYTLRDKISDIEGKYGTLPNHRQHGLKAKASAGRRVYQEGSMSWEQIRKTFEEKTDTKALHYINADGELKYHFGFMRAKYDHGCPTLIGTNPILHPHTNLPLSLRERARVMGFPDDFVFHGMLDEEEGNVWYHNHNSNMIKQTGRCIPCEFPGFLVRQFQAFLDGDVTYTCSGKRLAKKNKYIGEYGE